MNGVQVGAESVQEAQQDESEEEEEQRDGHCGVSNDLQWQDIVVLGAEESKYVRSSHRNRLNGMV